MDRQIKNMCNVINTKRVSVSNKEYISKQYVSLREINASILPSSKRKKIVEKYNSVKLVSVK